jgi:hypothetical protein
MMRDGLQLRRLMGRIIVEVKSAFLRVRRTTSALPLCIWKVKRSFLDNSKWDHSSLSLGFCFGKKKLPLSNKATWINWLCRSHQHPYGEINCVIQLTPGAELKGMSGWQGEGWTSPGPGTHHYPQVRKGALVALFFLPAGRISYAATPDMKQPLSI